jgi:hypothetical protein
MTTTTLLPPAAMEDVASAARSLESMSELAALVDCAVCELTHAAGTGDDPGCPDLRIDLSPPARRPEHERA